MSPSDAGHAAFNPARQVLDVLTRLVEAEEEPANAYKFDPYTNARIVQVVDPRRTWNAALRSPNAYDVRALVTNLVAFGKLVDEVASVMEQNSELYVALELSPTFAKIRTTIDTHLESLAGVLPGRENSNSQYAKAYIAPTMSQVLGDADWRSLKICDQFMRHGVGAQVRQEEINGLAEVAASVRADATTDDEISDDLRNFIVTELEAIEQGLAEVATTGTSPLRVVVNEVIATCVLDPAVQHDLKSSSVGRRFLAVVAAVGLAITSGIAEAATQALLQSPVVLDVVKSLTSGG